MKRWTRFCTEGADIFDRLVRYGSWRRSGRVCNAGGGHPVAAGSRLAGCDLLRVGRRIIEGVQAVTTRGSRQKMRDAGSHLPTLSFSLTTVYL